MGQSAQQLKLIANKAVGMVEDSEQKAAATLGNGAKLLTGLAGVTIGAKAANNKAEGKKGEGGDFLGSIKGGIHTRLLAFGQKLLQSGKALLMKGVDKLKGMLTPKVKFRLGSEEHELWVVKGSTRNIVMMASGEGKNVLEHEKVSREIKENAEFKKGIEELESSKDGEQIPEKKLVKLGDKISEKSPSEISELKDTVEITLKYETDIEYGGKVYDMDMKDFERKARYLQSLSDKGLLYKAQNPVSRDPNITKNYKDKLIRRIYNTYYSKDPEGTKKLIEKVREMDPDHRWELQLGGPDVSSNLKMMDWFTNRRIGNIIWNQIKDLEVGTKIKIKIER